MFAWFWRLLRIDGLHQLLKDEQGREASDAAAIEAQQLKIAARHIRPGTTSVHLKRVGTPRYISARQTEALKD